MDGPDARVAAAHLGVNAYSTNRQLYNLRLQYLTNLQANTVTDLVAARESIEWHAEPNGCVRTTHE